MTARELKKIFPMLETNVRLAPLTTFNIGGRAKFLLEIADKHKLVEAVIKAKTHKIPYLVLAGGSNMVFPDRLPAGLIICYRAKPRPGVTLAATGRTVYAEAGLPLMSLVRASLKAGLAGLEALSGIPGTVGGAIFGNAGAYGQTISDRLVEIEIFDGQNIRWLPAREGRFVYRGSIFKTTDWLILGGRWQLGRGQALELAQKSRAIIKTRNKKYLPGLKCPGSFFKNLLVADLSKKILRQIPPEKIIGGKVPAGYLLEAAGAKGLRRGKIHVPTTHGNLIVNDGGGKAADVRALAALMKKKVKAKFGITLEEEVQVI